MRFWVYVAEPPELSRLKCAGHYHKGNTDTNALQTEQFLVCRVTSRYNHRISDRTSIPCTKASPEILQPYILQHKHNSYYKPVQSIITYPNSVKHYTRHKFKVQSLSSRKKTRRLQHIAKAYQASPRKVSLIGVIAGRRQIPLYGPAIRQRAGPSQTSGLVLKTHT